MLGGLTQWNHPIFNIPNKESSPAALLTILGFQPIDCSSGLGLDNCMVKRLTSTLRTNKPLNKFLHLVSFHRLNPPKESQFLYRHWWPTGQLLSLPQDILIWSWINWNTKAFGRNIQRRPASIGMQSLHRLDFWCHEIFSPNSNTNCCVKFPNKKHLRKWIFGWISNLEATTFPDPYGRVSLGPL